MNGADEHENKTNEARISEASQKNPLIQREDLQQAIETKEWVTFIDQANHFLVSAILGTNKGIGWVVSFEETVIDQVILRNALRKQRQA